MNLDLFQCPTCGGKLRAASNDTVRCSQCGHTIQARDGILDFVAGHASTMLDDIDYDEYYRIDDSYSDILVTSIKSYVGPRWPASLGTLLELGCGTGGFSRSLLRIAAPPRAVLTDVSPKMLRICRQHLDRIGLRAGSQISFATYSGTEQSLVPAAFDTCVGTSVLHHILDVRTCLADMHRVLKPGGRAFFLEPNRRFHRALFSTLADIVAHYLSSGVAADDPDLSRIMNWICEVRCIVLHAGDQQFLATKEDKHMFIGEEMETLALDVGFDVAEALTTVVDPMGMHTTSVYLNQCGISEPRLADVLRLMPAFQPRYLSSLAPRDQSASFVLSLLKSAGRRDATSSARPATDVPLPASFTARDVALRYHLEINAKRDADGILLSIVGWCVATTDILWVRVTIGSGVHDIPVWLPRPDVHVAINANGLYPAQNSLCSGVDQTITMPTSTEKILGIAVDAVLMDGSTCNLPPHGEFVEGYPLFVRS
jgi:SAM-dependent methyltransferase